MATLTYTPLQTINLAANSSSIIFSGIPQTYRDLVLVTSLRTTQSAVSSAIVVRANGITSSSYSMQAMYASGSGNGAFDVTYSYYETYSASGASAAAYDYGFLRMDFIDYSSTNKHKGLLSYELNRGYGLHARMQSLATLDAISSLEVYSSSGDLVQNSTATLYGIAG